MTSGSFLTVVRGTRVCRHYCLRITLHMPWEDGGAVPNHCCHICRVHGADALGSFEKPVFLPFQNHHKYISLGYNGLSLYFRNTGNETKDCYRNRFGSNNTLTYVTESRCLGVIIDSHLSLNSHVESPWKSFESKVNQLPNWNSQRNVLIHSYSAHCYVL